jgi:hypothetical protein
MPRSPRMRTAARRTACVYVHVGRMGTEEEVAAGSLSDEALRDRLDAVPMHTYS